MLPPEITGDLGDRIHAGLLRLHAAYQPKQLSKSLCAAYDLYAGELLAAGWEMTETLLTQSIPLWVFRWAWSKEWLPRERQVGRVRGYFANSPAARNATPPHKEPIPNAELWAYTLRAAGGRIAHWQAETLSRKLAGKFKKQEDLRDLYVRAKVAGHKVYDIYTKSRVSRTTLYQCLKDPNSVEPESAAAIVEALREMAPPK